MTEYLEFRELQVKAGRKTKIWAVCSKRSSDILGTISWYGPWRQYCFYPKPETIWNHGCLEQVRKFCGLKTLEHREGPNGNISSKR